MEAIDIKEITLDTEVYLKEKIIFKNHEGKIVKTIYPKPEKAWEVFTQIVINWRKEVNNGIEKRTD